MVRIAQRAVGGDETHDDAVGFTRDIETDFAAFQPYRAAALAVHQPADQLTGNLPLALAEHMIDGSADCREPARDLAFGCTNRKSLWEFLGDESRRKIALAPARMIHQRREEPNVVADSFTINRIKPIRLRPAHGAPRMSILIQLC